VFSSESLCDLFDLPPDPGVPPGGRPELLLLKAVQQSGRSDRALVLYNPQDFSFVVRSAKTVDVCPLCQRAFEAKSGGKGNFASKSYFSMLARANVLDRAGRPAGSVTGSAARGGGIAGGAPAPAAPGSGPASPASGLPGPGPAPASHYRSQTPPSASPNAPEFLPNADPMAEENAMAEYYKRFFLQGKKLGSGGFGGVWMCRHVLQGFDLGTYAVKKVPIGTDRHWLLRVLQEVKALERLHRHPNIIEYHHSWIEYDQPADFGPKVPCLFILMDYADLGTLEDYCRRSLMSGEQEIWWHGISLLNALQHLHSNCVLHRDVKPLNVLLSSSNLQYPNVLLSDLGESMQVTARRPAGRTGCTGTLEYCAPELFLQDDAGSFLVSHDFASDMWGLGLILYFLCFGGLPYNREADVLPQIREAGRRPIELPRFPKYSKELLNLVKILLAPRPEDRPLTAHILRNAFVRRKWQDLTDELTTQSLDRDSTMESSGGMGMDDPGVVARTAPSHEARPAPHTLLPLLCGPEAAPCLCPH